MTLEYFFFLFVRVVLHVCWFMVTNDLFASVGIERGGGGANAHTALALARLGAAWNQGRPAGS